MDWSNERYVRLYTRDTKTWLKLGWEGQALLCLLFRKVDRAGILDDITEPDDDLSLITGLPIEVTKVGLLRLKMLGVVTINGGDLLIPKFMDAQEATKSDRQRQRDSRERRRSKAQASQGVTEDRGSVTMRDKESRVVTSGHEQSQAVTLCSAVPCSTVPKKESPTWQLADTLCDFLLAEMKAEKPDSTAKRGRGWQLDMDKLLRIDKRSEERIREVIRWACHHRTDGFSWAANIRSPKKLRAHFDQLEMQMKPATLTVRTLESEMR